MKTRQCGRFTRSVWFRRVKERKSETQIKLRGGRKSEIRTLYTLFSRTFQEYCEDREEDLSHLSTLSFQLEK